MLKSIIIYLVVPITLTLLFALSFFEKSKSKKVYPPKVLTLYIPVVGIMFLTMGLFLNIFYVEELDYIFIIVLLVAIILGCYILFYHLINTIKYGEDYLIYKGKKINFNDIERFGYDDRFYYFVCNTGQKIKISRLAVGFENLYYAITTIRGKF